MWYSLAAAQGEDDAAENRDAIAEQTTPDRIAEAERRAREWVEIHPYEGVDHA